MAILCRKLHLIIKPPQKVSIYGNAFEDSRTLKNTRTVNAGGLGQEISGLPQ